MVYLLEDDSSIRDLIVYTVKSQGMDIEGFEKPSQFKSALEKKVPDLAILDIMLPEESGLEVLKYIRKNRELWDFPVLMLTAKSTEFDKVVGLDTGADDYLTKPFGMMELMARIRALLRRSSGKDTRVEGENSGNYKVGGLELDVKAHSVKAGESAVTLTFKEFSLLEYLLVNAGRVLSREQLIEEVWGYDFIGDARTVDVHIRTLRQKLGSYGAYIETVHGVGYKIDKQVD